MADVEMTEAIEANRLLPDDHRISNPPLASPNCFGNNDLGKRPEADTHYAFNCWPVIAHAGGYTWRCTKAIYGGYDDDAAKALKEARYHFRHSSGWVVRLGDGTEESHHRIQRGVDAMWRFTGEMFLADAIDGAAVEGGFGVDPTTLRGPWAERISRVLTEATLQLPEDPFQRTGGRRGFHTEHLGHLLGELQWMQRTFPGLEW